MTEAADDQIASVAAASADTELPATGPVRATAPAVPRAADSSIVRTPDTAEPDRQHPGDRRIVHHRDRGHVDVAAAERMTGVLASHVDALAGRLDERLFRTSKRIDREVHELGMALHDRMFADLGDEEHPIRDRFADRLHGSADRNVPAKRAGELGMEQPVEREALLVALGEQLDWLR